MVQRWEYMTWVVGFAGTSDFEMQSWHGGIVKYIDGQLIQDWRDGSRLAVKLSQAGEDGWELITVINQGGSSDPLYIFKRPAS